MRGRKPDPARERRGTGHRPLAGRGSAVAELVLADELPPAPAHIDDAGKVLWTAIVDELGAVDGRDVWVLEAAIDQLLVMREATAYRQQYGLVLQTRVGDPDNGVSPTFIPAPWVRMERDAGLAFLRYAEQLGLTRLARTRLGVLNAAGATLMQHLAHSLTED